MEPPPSDEALTNPQLLGAFNSPRGDQPIPLQRSRSSSIGIVTNVTGVDGSNNSSTPPSSTTSASRLPPLSTSVSDRVFPIRSVISIEPTSAPGDHKDLSDLQSPGADKKWPGRGRPRGYSTVAAANAESVETSPASHRIGTVVPPENHSSKGSLSQPEHDVPRKPVSPRTRPGPGPIRGNKHLTFSPNQLISMAFDGSNSTDGTGTSSCGQADRSPSPSEAAIMTSRYKHVVTDSGHAVITGRDGDALEHCEDEPIHIPGAVQGFGVLIAMREELGKMVVRVASENSTEILGYSPSQLFTLESFCDILSSDYGETFLEYVDFVREDAVDLNQNGPEVFVLSIAQLGGGSRRFWCAMHINYCNRDLIICEFEMEDDKVYPVYTNGDTIPSTPEDTLGGCPTAEEFAESTVNISRPLRVLRSARRKRGQAAAMDVFNIMSQVQEQLSSAESLQELLKIVSGVVKELTGFHRVMIYQFDAQWNGIVVAELVDPKATKDLYKGLHFPASDIPKQARDLYKINKVRLLYDRDQVTSRLVCRTHEDLETPLDMTHGYLRAMSPIHVKYLANMAVRASMSISINAFNELWGLISCHSYGSRGMRVSFPIRKMCRLIGDTASRSIERLSYASRLQARKLINTVPTEANPSGYIVASSDDLLALFTADYGALSIHDETKILGKLAHSQEVLALLEYLRLRRLDSVLSSHEIARDFPDLRYPPGFKHISGLLYVPLSAGGSDFIVFFRRGQLTEVKWAGNPYEKKVKEGTAALLEPRKSFKTWTETIVGRSREWSEADVETAAVLCLVYGKFIQVWRQKEAAIKSTQLTRLLLANSAHEVRTPLNAIINYLEIALEGSIDQETRDHLSKSHSASKSLIYVINDLLDLTNTETGQSLNKDEIFDLPSTLREATDMFEGEAKRKMIDYSVSEYPGIPRFVLGDQRRVRQVVANVISNAIQHTSSGFVSVDLWLSPTQPNPEFVGVELAVQDSGAGMSPQTVEGLFRELEEVSAEEGDIFNPVPEPSTKEGANTAPKRIAKDGGEKRVLGLGLAVVARIVRNMGGQLRVKSEEGKGSRFTVQLRFPLPEEEESSSPPEQQGVFTPPAQTSQQPTEGEITLVDSQSIKQPSLQRRTSRDSGWSGGSRTSSKSGKSDVDRLIDAIQEPAQVAKSSGHFPERAGNRHSIGSGTGRAESLRSIGTYDPSSHLALPRENSSLEAHNSSLSSPAVAPPGEEAITDSGMPLKPVRILDDGVNEAQEEREVQSEDSSKSVTATDERSSGDFPSSHDCLRVLVAEDDPVNSKILQKRLEKLGHTVHVTINGEACAIAYRSNPTLFDIVLMDIQMPIVDGMGSTKMIRGFEQASTAKMLSPKASHNGRIPIFAVSASLQEKDLQFYVDLGFDGWIPKPLDFKRIDQIFQGVDNDDSQAENIYKPGMWECGGWFQRRG